MGGEGLDASKTRNGERDLSCRRVGMRTSVHPGGRRTAPTGWSVKENKSRMTSRFPGWVIRDRLVSATEAVNVGRQMRLQWRHETVMYPS